MIKEFECSTPPQESEGALKTYENIYMHEWMAKEMIDEVKNQGHNPTEIYFSAGFDKSSNSEGQPIRSLFFTMNFRDGEEHLKAYWDPETKGEKLKIEYLGKAVDDKKE
jgi:hypothetical protein